MPWRAPLPKLPPPYAVFVSEAMLQQTQVATVIPYFHRFMEAFPTLADLANADIQEVLKLWQGLGYYSRAKNLHKAAQLVIREHQGIIPRDIEQLRALPGVGPYTAGAIASLAYNLPQPILDGNIIRVIARIDADESDFKNTKIRQKFWDRSAQLLDPSNPSDFNSAMMELGATVCLPKSPDCENCPVASLCQAYRTNEISRYPAKPPRKARPIEQRSIHLIQHRDNFLMEQRPPKGRWASLWQWITLPPQTPLPWKTSAPKLLGQFNHDLTHRQYRFKVYLCRWIGTPPDLSPRVWVPIKKLPAYPLSAAQLKVLEFLQSNNTH